MDNKTGVKKEPWFYALISACSGFIICLLADCFYAWLARTLYWGETHFSEYYDMLRSYQRQAVVVQLLLNFLLVASGILILRFHKNRGKGLKKRNAVLGIVLILEILAFIITASIVGPLPIIFWITIFVCIIAAVLVGLYIRTYKTGTYIICCVTAIIFSVPCTLFMNREIYIGRCFSEGMMAVPFVLQPFAVLLPIISLIRGVAFSQMQETQSQNGAEASVRGMGNEQMRCPFCGKEQEAGNRFCCQCGRELAAAPPGERHCPQCGVKVEAGMLFCKECGTKIL